MADEHRDERVPTDVAGDDLVRLYVAGARRLEGIIRGYLRRGIDPRRAGTPAQQRGDRTAAYRVRQLAAARGITAALRAQGNAFAVATVERAYAAALVAVDRVALGDGVADSGIVGRFGGIHQRAVLVLALNMSRSLERAAAAVDTNVGVVFERAAALEGPLLAGGELDAVGFIGRREDDPWRRVALEQIGAGLVAGDTTRQITEALARELEREGVTDALTGFVDRRGARWSLDNYAEMVVRTTTREATTRATDTRLGEHGLDLCAISSHPHAHDECTPYDGNTFARPGTPAAEEGRYPVLEERPPFHPRCRHVLGPAVASFDDYLAELERAAAEGHTLDAPASSQPPRRSESSAPAPAPEARASRPDVRAELLPTQQTSAPPFGPRARPSQDADTLARLEAQRVAYIIDGDPGPEPGAREAWERDVAGLVEAPAPDARAVKRAQDLALGEDLAKFIDRAWARKVRIRERLAAGELTVEDVEELALEEYQRVEGRRLEREARKGPELGGELRTRQIPCFVCGRFKRRPADVCDFCGDDPVTVGGDARDFNRGYGYAS